MNDLLLVLFCAVFGLTLFILGISVGEKNLQNEFTQTKCAQFNPVTSEFELLKDVE